MKKILDIYEGIDEASMAGKPMSKNMIELSSVGTALDSKTGMIYPMYVDGSYDSDMQTDISDDVSQEWIDKLSKDDRKKVDSVIKKLKIDNKQFK